MVAEKPVLFVKRNLFSFLFSRAERAAKYQNDKAEKDRAQQEREEAKLAAKQEALSKERAAKYQNDKAEKDRAQQEREEAKLAAKQEALSKEAAKKSEHSRLQFRLTDGSFVTQQFSCRDPLETARQFIAQVSKM
jgi:hypothetical protein